jgi:hypothetical protein
VPKRKSRLLKIVLDTNILISAIVFGGKPREILEQVIAANLSLGISKPIIEELRDVLSRDKFKYPASVIHFIISQLEEEAQFVVPHEKLEIIERDDADNRILECAAEFEADFIITGDSHLLELKKFNNIRILKAVDFLEVIKNTASEFVRG